MPPASHRHRSLACLLILVACADADPPREARSAAPLIADAAHGGPVAGFIFLAPLVPPPGFSGTFDPLRRPVVRIDRVDPTTGASLRHVATFTSTTGRGAQRVRVGRRAYRVRWNTASAGLSPAETYRIRVFDEGHLLGFADLDVVENRRQLRSVDTSQFVPLIRDNVLVIRFRIESAPPPPPPTDRDGDGVLDGDDNRPETPNLGQADSDGDGIGDACECLASSCPALGPCQTASCDPGTGDCVDTPRPDGTACGDGDACNGAELCAAGACVAGAPLSCDDANPCTGDACDPATGCSHLAAPDGTACGDGDACNGAEVCAAGACVAGPALTCDDANPCTTDACDPGTGCTRAPLLDGTACSDGDACNGAEVCVAGACAAGAALFCDDANPCTVDRCEPLGGCAHDAAPDGLFAGSAPTSCGIGACAATGSTVCRGGVIADDCTPGAPPSAYDVWCFGLDLDCDGVPDDDYLPLATSRSGQTGRTACAAGAEGVDCSDPSPAPALEVEPNDDPALATPSPRRLGLERVSLQGLIDGTGDVDVYRVEGISTNAVALTAAVYGDPGARESCHGDLRVEARLESGALIGAAEDGPTGPCPTLRAIVNPGPVFLFVSGSGAAPYTLDVRFSYAPLYANAPSAAEAHPIAEQTNLRDRGLVTFMGDLSDGPDYLALTIPFGSAANLSARAYAVGTDLLTCAAVDTLAIQDELGTTRAVDFAGGADPCARIDAVGPLGPGLYVLSLEGSGEYFVDIELEDPSAGCGDGVISGAEECEGGACCVDCRFASAGTACGLPGSCEGGICDGASGECPGGGPAPAGTLCRPALDACDAAEHCDGFNLECPYDEVLGAGASCRPAVGECDVEESCDGVSPACPDDVLLSAGTSCRAPDGDCDLEDFCDGLGPFCVDVTPEGEVCRDSAGPCDPADVCPFGSHECNDTGYPAGAVCRESTGACDAEERCDGTGPSCPADLAAPAGVACRSASGSGCDVAELCDGSSFGCGPDAFAPASECGPEDHAIVLAEQEVYAVEIDAAGNTYAAGRYFSPHEYIAKYAPDGQLLWRTTVTELLIGDFFDLPFDLDASGDVVVATPTRLKVIDGASGAIVSDHHAHWAGRAEPRRLRVAPDGTVVVSGELVGSPSRWTALDFMEGLLPVHPQWASEPEVQLRGSPGFRSGFIANVRTDGFARWFIATGVVSLQFRTVSSVHGDLDFMPRFFDLDASGEIVLHSEDRGGFQSWSGARRLALHDGATTWVMPQPPNPSDRAPGVGLVDLAVDAAGDTIFAGYFDPTRGIGSGFGVVAPDPWAGETRRMFVSKMRPSGATAWTRTLGGPDDEHFVDFDLDAEGNPVFTAFGTPLSDFGGGPHEGVSTAGPPSPINPLYGPCFQNVPSFRLTDVLLAEPVRQNVVVQLDAATGAYRWSRQLPTPLPSVVAADRSVAVSGLFRDTVSFEGTFVTAAPAHAAFNGWQYFVHRFLPRSATFGNGTVDPGEECEPGGCCTGWARLRPDGFVCAATGAVCSGESGVCNPGCGNSTLDPGEDCELGPCCARNCLYSRPTRLCRGVAHDWDVEDYCDGTAAECPPDCLGAEGAVCDDGDPATHSDVVTAAGECRGTPQLCPAPTTCVSWTPTADGSAFCTAVPAPRGTPCSDGHSCVVGLNKQCDGQGSCVYLGGAL